MNFIPSETMEQSLVDLCVRSRFAHLFSFFRLLEVLDHHQSPALHTDLGHCYTHMKKRDEAFEQFEAALRQVIL